MFLSLRVGREKEALKQALLHEKQYLQNEEFAEFYFDLLISTQDFLYARKLIASTDFMKLSSSGSLKNPICRRIIRTNGEAEDQGTPQ